MLIMKEYDLQLGFILNAFKIEKILYLNFELMNSL